MKKLKRSIVLLLPLLLASCDALAPLFSINVELTTADYTIGEWRSHTFAEDRFVCTPRIHVRAWENGEDRRETDAEWTGGDVRIIDPESGQVAEMHSISRQTMNQRFGHRIYPDMQISRDFPLNASIAPFQWELTASFYDPESRYTGQTRLRSECRDVVAAAGSDDKGGMQTPPAPWVPFV